MLEMFPVPLDAPQDVRDLINSGGDYYADSQGNIHNHDGSVAYEKSANGYNLVELKYGNWGLDGNPADVSLDSLDCVKNKTLCTNEAVSSVFAGAEYYSTNTLSTGSLDRIPLKDIETGNVIGYLDRVWVKTNSAGGGDVFFPFVIQAVTNDKPRSNQTATGRFLIYYLTSGDKDVYNERGKPIKTLSVQELAKIFSEGVKLRPGLFSKFPIKIPQEWGWDETLGDQIQAYYADPTHSSEIDSLIESLTDKSSSPPTPEYYRDLVQFIINLDL
jgi:hypothetical protein